MSKGSTSGAIKTRPPTHQNETAFKHNKSSKKTKKILESPISKLLCPSCKAVIEWRKQYRKYKPLTIPKKCISCQEKTIKSAYHTRCDACSVNADVCAKCGDSRSYDEAKASAKIVYNPQIPKEIVVDSEKGDLETEIPSSSLEDESEDDSDILD
jgi:hypothetical protein